MEIEFRQCKYNDIDFILKLKELCLKLYVEKIYGWDFNIQKEKTIQELERHIDDIKIIMVNEQDIGITTFYEEDDVYIVGLIMIHPKYQNQGIATNIIKNYINIANDENKKIIIKTYKENPARRLYERLGFVKCNEDNTHVHMMIAFDDKIIKLLDNK